MAKLRCIRPALLLLLPGLAFSQDAVGGWRTYRPNQEVRVSQLPGLTARSHDLPDVLVASLDIIFHDKSICCGGDSSLEDQDLSANPLAVREIASKLQGRHLLSDGRPIQITADVVPVSAGDISTQIVGPLQANHALLMVWNSHLYVLYGAVFDGIYYSDHNSTVDVIHKLLLLDPRFPDSRREVIFNRDNDDWGKVQGLLLLTVAPQ